MNKKILVFLFAMIFLIGIASAEVFSFDNGIGSYDNETQTITISNLFGLGKDYAVTKLIWGNTSVGVGIDTHVGTFNYTMLEPEGSLDDLGIISLNDNGAVMTRGKQYKVLTWKEEDKFIQVCEDEIIIDETVIPTNCSYVENGTRIIEEWMPISNPNYNFEIGKEYTIGVFVDTEEGDYGDWFPTIANVELRQWATWSSGLNTDLISYYRFRELGTNTTVYDSYGTNHGTSTVNTVYREATGILDKSYIHNITYYTTLTDEDFRFNADTDDFAISFWIYPTSVAGFQILLDKRDAGSDGWMVGLNGDKIYLALQSKTLTGTTVVGTNAWYHVILNVDRSGNAELFLNNATQGTVDVSGTAMSTTTALRIGMRSFSTPASQYNGQRFDELAVWGRLLTSDERDDLYNNGNALEPIFAAPDNVPSVSINSPANDSVYGQPGVTFSADVSDDINLVNVSLYIDGALDQTNSSGINGTTYNFSKSLTTGRHNWSIIAYDNSSQSNESALRFLNITIVPPTIQLSYPKDNLVTTVANQNFYAYVYDNLKVQNVSFYYDGSLDQTNATGLNATNYTFSKTLTEGSHTWYMEAYDNESYDSTSATRTIILDTTPPVISVTSPTGSEDYLKAGATLTLNFTVTDAQLDTCISQYNGTNTTRACSSGVLFSTDFTYASGQNTVTVFANDTAGNWNSASITWFVKVFENSRTVNNASYETKTETMSINVNSNASLSAVALVYNGTEYTTTKSGNTYSRALDVPIGVSNNSVRWKFTYAGSSFYSTYSYQNISLLNFSLCDSNLNNDFLNVSFKDEDDLSNLNATIPTSTFNYYLGTGGIFKTYTYFTASLNNNYTFCAIPTTETLKVVPYMQYKQEPNYPQRIWNPDAQSYTSTAVNKTLYLLDVNDGQYVTFQIINSAEQPVSAVDVQATRVISGSTVTVANGETDSAGAVTFWLNPDFVHTFTFTKTGYETYIYTTAPTQSAYTIVLGGGSEVPISYNKGIIYSTLPTLSSLVNDTTYTFGLNITSDYWTLVEYGFDLRLSNGTTITGSSTNTEGTPLTKAFNTGSLTKIYLDYYWIINSTTTSGTREYKIYNDELSQWSIKTFFTDYNNYMDSGFFGIDNFGRYLLIFLTLFLLTGVLGYKFGLNSPTFIGALVFFVIFFFDVGVGIIPDIAVLGGVTIPYLLTIISGIIFVSLILNEVFKG